MDRAIDMIGRLSSDTVGYHRFVLRFGKYQDSPLCLTEGEDAKYYRFRVKNLCEGIEPQFINCEGKKGVIDSFNLISKVSEYQCAKIFAFVDRDFDSPIENPLIYVTPCYSVENLYTSREVLKTIIIDQLKIEEFENKDDFDLCIRLFIKNQLAFHEAITELNAWILCQRDLIEGGITSKLNLNKNEKFVMDHFFQYDLVNGVTKQYDLEKIYDVFKQAHRVSKEDVEKLYQDERLQPPQQSFRGKYELAFFRKFLRNLVHLLNKKKENIFSQSRSVNFTVSDTNMLSELSQYAETPSCLVRYINQTWSKYKIQEVDAGTKS